MGSTLFERGLGFLVVWATREAMIQIVLKSVTRSSFQPFCSIRNIKPLHRRAVENRNSGEFDPGMRVMETVLAGQAPV